jgi:hypothetical protein
MLVKPPKRLGQSVREMTVRTMRFATLKAIHGRKIRRALDSGLPK